MKSPGIEPVNFLLQSEVNDPCGPVWPQFKQTDIFYCTSDRQWLPTEWLLKLYDLEKFLGP